MGGGGEGRDDGRIEESKEAHPTTHAMYIRHQSSQMPIPIPELLIWLAHPESRSWDSSAMP